MMSSPKGDSRPADVRLRMSSMDQKWCVGVGRQEGGVCGWRDGP